MSIHKFNPINCLQGLSLPIRNTIVGTSFIMSTLANRSGALIDQTINTPVHKFNPTVRQRGLSLIFKKTIVWTSVAF